MKTKKLYPLSRNIFVHLAWLRHKRTCHWSRHSTAHEDTVDHTKNLVKQKRTKRNIENKKKYTS